MNAKAGPVKHPGAVTRLTLAVVLLAVVHGTSGCASLGSRRGEAELVRDEFGFTITEDVNAGLGVRGDFRRAVELLGEGDYEAGIELLLKVVEAAPEITSAHIDLGIAYRMTDQLEKAEASLVRALEINPRHPAALTELGLVYRRLGRFDDSRASYEKALGYHPNFHFARRNLAILCDLYIGDLECAVKHYELYLQMVPHDEKAEIWLSDLRNRLGLPPREQVAVEKKAPAAAPAPAPVETVEPAPEAEPAEAEPVDVAPEMEASVEIETEAVPSEIEAAPVDAEVEAVPVEAEVEAEPVATEAAMEAPPIEEEAPAAIDADPQADAGTESEAPPPAEAAPEGETE